MLVTPQIAAIIAVSNTVVPAVSLQPKAVYITVVSTRDRLSVQVNRITITIIGEAIPFSGVSADIGRKSTADILVSYLSSRSLQTKHFNAASTSTGKSMTVHINHITSSCIIPGRTFYPTTFAA
jgi:hypothetical protein